MSTEGQLTQVLGVEPLRAVGLDDWRWVGGIAFTDVPPDRYITYSHADPYDLDCGVVGCPGGLRTVYDGDDYVVTLYEHRRGCSVAF